MKRLLLVHNYYGSSSPSGENLVFDAEKRLLQERGHEVLEFTRHSDSIRALGLQGLLRGALAAPWNPFVLRAVRGLLRKEHPAVMHVHNTFPLLSPAVFHAARGLPTATVLTLHNFRCFCASATLIRDDHPCTECLDRHSVIPALRYGCYRGSRAATTPVAAVVALHRLIGTWEKHVDAFVALTNFQKDVLSQAGLPADRVHVKPNFHPSPPGVAPWHERENKAMFVGRLGREKGVHVLLEAWRQWGRAAPRLEIAGDGPERASLEARARGAGLGDRVSFLGQVSHVEVEQRLRLSKLLIVPSLCYETFSLVVREAFAAGVAVAASRLESLSSILEDGRTGLLFKPGDAADLRDRIASAWAEIDLLSRMGTAARVTFERDCTAGRTYEMLRAIYQAAIRRRTLSA